MAKTSSIPGRLLRRSGDEWQSFGGTAPRKETATLADLQLKVEHSHATIPFVLDGQVLEENLHWCGKDQDWLERTAQANTLLPEEILLLVGNETEDYFLLKKESRRKGSSR